MIAIKFSLLDFLKIHGVQCQENLFADMKVKSMLVCLLPKGYTIFI